MRKIILQKKLLPFYLFLTVIACKGQEPSTDFELEGKSTICIINETNDSLNVKINNWSPVPMEEQKLDTSLASNNSLAYVLKVQGKIYYDASLNGTNYRLFSQPNARDTIVVNNGNSAAFSGDSKIINQFLLRKTETFNSTEADWMPRVNATHNADNFSTVAKVNDSVTQVQFSFLQQNSGQLPEWYVNFEAERLKYLNTGFKLNSFFYRKAMLDKNETFPADFRNELNTSIKAQNPFLLGNMRYMYFLNDYIYYKTDSSFSSPKPASKEEWQERYNNLFTTAQHELDSLVKDAYLTSSICKIIDSRSHILDSAWLSLIENEGMRYIVQNQLSAHEVLPKGADLPYFYLQAYDGEHYEPDFFQNKIVLINFWATWCKPCIKEFPEENALVKKFAAEPVTIVNICVDSDFDKWKEMIEKYDLKTLNLIAQENWNDVLAEKFDIGGLPHAVLVDWNGKIVQNKCPRASEGIDKIIAELLKEMKTEVGN